MLTPKLRLLLAFFMLPLFMAAQVTISGKVTSNGSPEGLSKVSVMEKGTSNGVTSNDKGEFTITVKSKTAVLVFTYQGADPVEIAVGNQTFIGVAITEEVSPYAEVVVTAGRKPTRKLETTTSVEIINAKALKIIKPEGIAEAITAAPGLYVNTSQGRRGGIVTRGFPDGGNPLGGLDYTGILIDGLPSFGSTGRLPEAGFGFDMNVEKVEVVRGSTATLFGRASAAGAVNVISKTGGEKTSNSFKFTNYNKLFSSNGLNYRFDFNSNGKLFKNRNWRYNIGGWLLNDAGFKNTGFNDEGFQLRGNIDYLLPKNKGSIRVYALGSDYVFQNLTDIPADMNTMKVAGNWKPEQTLQNFPNFYGKNYTVYESGGGFPTRRVAVNGDSVVRSVRQAMQDNSYGRNFNIGTTIMYKTGKNSAIEERFRYQNLKSGTKYSFALPSFYRNNSVTRLLLDGDANDADVMNEFRYKKQWLMDGKTKHDLVFGHFISRTHLKPLTYSFLHVLNPANADSLKFAPLAPPFVNVPWSGTNDYPRGSITRRGDYIEQVSSLFAGDEITVNDKLKINIGLRYDWVKLEMKETKKPYDVTLVRNEKHSDWSGSVGFNYLLKKNMAIYGNLNRAFRAPDYTAYTSLEWISFTDRRWLRAPNGIDKNENIISGELGYRSSIQDVGFDVALFYTKINDRLSRIFENGIVVSKPFGSNRITGAELSLYYMPQSVKGLAIRTNFTYQNAIFTDFKLPVDRGGVLGNGATVLNVNPAGNLYGNTLIDEGGGNYSINLNKKKLPAIPNFIWNSSIVYNHEYFGVDVSSNYNGRRFVDATNVLEYNKLMIINAGVYFKVPLGAKSGDLRIGAQAKNLTNRSDIQNLAGLQATDAALGQKQKTPNWVDVAPAAGVPIWGQGYVQLPRRWLFYISYDF